MLKRTYIISSLSTLMISTAVIAQQQDTAPGGGSTIPMTGGTFTTNGGSFGNSQGEFSGATPSYPVTPPAGGGSAPSANDGSTTPEETAEQQSDETQEEIPEETSRFPQVGEAEAEVEDCIPATPEGEQDGEVSEEETGDAESAPEEPVAPAITSSTGFVTAEKPEDESAAEEGGEESEGKPVCPEDTEEGSGSASVNPTADSIPVPGAITFVKPPSAPGLSNMGLKNDALTLVNNEDWRSMLSQANFEFALNDSDLKRYSISLSGEDVAIPEALYSNMAPSNDMPKVIQMALLKSQAEFSDLWEYHRSSDGPLRVTKYDVDRFGFIWGKISATGNGNFEISEDGMVNGNMTATVQPWQDLLAAIEFPDPEKRNVVGDVLGLMAEGDKLDVEIEIVNSQVKIGPLTVMELEPIQPIK